MLDLFNKENLDRALVLAKRREDAEKKKLFCKTCSSLQIQLRDWQTDILEYKCRECKTIFYVDTNHKTYKAL